MTFDAVQRWVFWQQAYQAWDAVCPTSEGEATTRTLWLMVAQAHLAELAALALGSWTRG